jgi:SAM-dependent methyltransferase
VSTESAAAWSEVAGGWERHAARMSASLAPVTERLLERLAPRPGETILEIGAGLGEVGLRVAGLVRPGGRVLVTDVSEGMLDAARRNAGDAENVEVMHVDAQTMPFEAASVDGIVARFAYMLVPNLEAAFAESSRVLRPGGRLAFAVWAEGTENRWASTIGRALVELGLVDPPEPDTPGPFRLAERERLRELVTGAGLEEPEIDDVEIQMRYVSFEEYWEVTRDLSMSLRNALTGLSAEDTTVLRGRVEEALTPYAGEDGLVIPGLARVLSTRRPG